KVQSKPQEKTDFITKQFNMFVKASAHPFIEADVLKRNNEHIDINTLKGRACVGGYDLSDSEDFTSACLVFPLDDGKISVHSHSWLTEKKVQADNENIPYREYEELGYLTIVPEEYIKKEYVEEWFIEKSKEYAIEKIIYDR